MYVCMYVCLDGREFDSRPQRLILVTGISDRIRAGIPPQYSSKPPMLTQPPTLSGTKNVYQPKCGDALRIGYYGSLHLWINVRWQVKLCDPSLARVIPQLIISDIQIGFL